MGQGPRQSPKEYERIWPLGYGPVEPSKPKPEKGITLRRFIASHPDLSLAEMRKAVAEAGIDASPSSLNTMYSWMRQSMEVLREMGWTAPGEVAKASKPKKPRKGKPSAEVVDDPVSDPVEEQPTQS